MAATARKASVKRSLSGCTCVTEMRSNRHRSGNSRRQPNTRERVTIDLDRPGIAFGERRPDRRRSAIRITRVEWRAGVVLDAELNGLGRLPPGDLGHEYKAEVDAGGDAAGRDQVSI